MEVITSYLGGSSVWLSGSSFELALPVKTREIWMDVENGNLYYEINASTGSASGSSPGFVPQNSVRVVPTVYNINNFYIYGGSDVIAHVQYFG